LKNDKVIVFNVIAYINTDFSAFKNVQATTPVQ